MGNMPQAPNQNQQERDKERKKEERITFVITS